MKSSSRVLVAFVSAVVLLGAAQASHRDLLATDITEDITVPYNPAVVGTDPLGQLSFSDTRVQRTVSGLAPEQVTSRQYC